MDDEGAFDRVARWLVRSTGARRDQITLESPLSTFEIDSLDFVEFAMELEDEGYPDLADAKRPPKTVGDLVEWLRSSGR
jgi:hypothetical protein